MKIITYKEKRAAIICANMFFGQQWINECYCSDKYICHFCKVREKFDIKPNKELIKKSLQINPNDEL